MTTRAIALLLVGGVCLGLASCPAKRAAGPNNGPAGKKNVDNDPCITAYQHLKPRGRLYAGTVESVTPNDTGGDFMQHVEYGEIRFRVVRTVFGPPREEMTIPYWWVENDKVGGGEALEADWIGGSPWPARPKAGEQLLLLIGDEEDAKERNSEYPLVYRWEVSPDDPFVEDFAVAGRFLATKDEETQDDLYRQLCESRFHTIRQFALDAAFHYIGRNKRDPEFAYLGEPGYSGYGGDYNPVRQSHLALLYLKHATPRLRPEERLSVTGSFAYWFESHWRGVTDELLAAFEDWYLKELSVRDDMRRPKRALEGLEQIVKSNGAATTVGLFKKTGRAGLLERLGDCSRAGDPDVEKLSKALLARLEAP